MSKTRSVPRKRALRTVNLPSASTIRPLAEVIRTTDDGQAFAEELEVKSHLEWQTKSHDPEQPQEVHPDPQTPPDRQPQKVPKPPKVKPEGQTRNIPKPPKVSPANRQPSREEPKDEPSEADRPAAEKPKKPETPLSPTKEPPTQSQTPKPEEVTPSESVDDETVRQEEEARELNRKVRQRKQRELDQYIARAKGEADPTEGMMDQEKTRYVQEQREKEKRGRAAEKQEGFDPKDYDPETLLRREEFHQRQKERAIQTPEQRKQEQAATRARADAERMQQKQADRQQYRQEMEKFAKVKFPPEITEELGLVPETPSQVSEEDVRKVHEHFAELERQFEPPGDAERDELDASIAAIDEALVNQDPKEIESSVNLELKDWIVKKKREERNRIQDAVSEQTNQWSENERRKRVAAAKAEGTYDFYETYIPSNEEFDQIYEEIWEVESQGLDKWEPSPEDVKVERQRLEKETIRGFQERLARRKHRLREEQIEVQRKADQVARFRELVEDTPGMARWLAKQPPFDWPGAVFNPALKGTLPSPTGKTNTLFGDLEPLEKLAEEARRYPYLLSVFTSKATIDHIPKVLENHQRLVDREARTKPPDPGALLDKLFRGGQKVGNLVPEAKISFRTPFEKRNTPPQPGDLIPVEDSEGNVIAMGVVDNVAAENDGWQHNITFRPTTVGVVMAEDSSLTKVPAFATEGERKVYREGKRDWQGYQKPGKYADPDEVLVYESFQAVRESLSDDERRALDEGIRRGEKLQISPEQVYPESTRSAYEMGYTDEAKKMLDEFYYLGISIPANAADARKMVEHETTNPLGKTGTLDLLEAYLEYLQKLEALSPNDQRYLRNAERDRDNYLLYGYSAAGPMLSDSEESKKKWTVAIANKEFNNLLQDSLKIVGVDPYLVDHNTSLKGSRNPMAMTLLSEVYQDWVDHLERGGDPGKESLQNLVRQKVLETFPPDEHTYDSLMKLLQRTGNPYDVDNWDFHNLKDLKTTAEQASTENLRAALPMLLDLVEAIKNREDLTHLVKEVSSGKTRRDLDRLFPGSFAKPPHNDDKIFLEQSATTSALVFAKEILRRMKLYDEVSKEFGEVYEEFGEAKPRKDILQKIFYGKRDLYQRVYDWAEENGLLERMITSRSREAFVYDIKEELKSFKDAYEQQRKAQEVTEQMNVPQRGGASSPPVEYDDLLEVGEAPEAPLPEGVLTEEPQHPPKYVSTAHRKFSGEIRAGLKIQKHLSDEQKESYGTAMDRVIGQMPAAALREVRKNLEDIVWHESIDALSEAARKDGVPMPTKGKISGRSRPTLGLLYIDGKVTKRNSPGLGGDQTNTYGTYAHELGHIIDKDWKYSNEKEWKRAFHEEIVGDFNDPPTLSEYARISRDPREGFAEIIRLVYGSDVDLDQAELTFPKCFAFLRKHGLYENKPIINPKEQQAQSPLTDTTTPTHTEDPTAAAERKWDESKERLAELRAKRDQLAKELRDAKKRVKKGDLDPSFVDKISQELEKVRAQYKEVNKEDSKLYRAWMKARAGETSRRARELAQHKELIDWHRIIAEKKITPQKEVIDPDAPIAERIGQHGAAQEIMDRIRQIDDTSENFQKLRKEYGAACNLLRDWCESHQGWSTNPKLIKEYETLVGYRDELRDEVYSSSKRNQVVHEMIKDAIPEGTKIYINAGMVPHASFTTAQAWLDGLVSGTKTRPDQPFPEMDVTAYEIPKDQEQRAYSDGGNIYFSRFDTPKTIIHEIGHVLEYVFPDISKAAHEFLHHRTGHQQEVYLQQVPELRACGYAAWERGKNDNFDKAFGTSQAYYVGKIYSHNATEITSMGLQILYEEPIRFAQQDPEYFAFMIGILDGSLRKPQKQATS